MNDFKNIRRSLINLLPKSLDNFLHKSRLAIVEKIFSDSPSKIDQFLLGILNWISDIFEDARHGENLDLLEKQAEKQKNLCLIYTLFLGK